jgi:hypothetical protein
MDFYGMKNDVVQDVPVVNKLTPADHAKAWTIDNPPHDRESISDYYTRYRTNNPQGILKIPFGKIMAKSIDYKQYHSGKIYYWTKA